MQMDPTTLQLIQFLERTVSSGKRPEPFHHLTSRVEKPVRAIFPGSSRDIPGISRETRRPTSISGRRDRPREVRGEQRVAISPPGKVSSAQRARSLAVLGIPGLPGIPRDPAATRRPRPDETASRLARVQARYRAPLVLLLGALFGAGKVLSRWTVARDTKRPSERRSLTYNLSILAHVINVRPRLCLSDKNELLAAQTFLQHAADSNLVSSRGDRLE